MLFNPLHINGMLLPNRLVLPAMVTRLSGEDGHINQDIRERYLRFAEGEVGLIVIEAMAVHGAKSGPLLRLSDDSFIPGLADLAKEIHDIEPFEGCSANHSLSEDCAERMATENQRFIERRNSIAIIEAYGAAAGRARTAGFDGVELHMAHAYTLSSFLSLTQHAQ